jgi:toxin FitB
MAPDGARSVKAWARAVNESELFISILTLAEYDKGIANLKSGEPSALRHAATRDALENRFVGRILPLSNNVVRRWGAISGAVKRDTGHPPPVIDTLLAATAIEAKLYLVSRNSRDLAHSGAVVFDPWRDDIAAYPVTKPPRQSSRSES